MKRHIMIAFISLVNSRSIKEPVCYADIQGEPYTAIQTNEAAVVYLQRKFKDAPLDKIFMIVSNKVETDPAPEGNEFGVVTHLEFFKRRVERLYPTLHDHFEQLPYDDDTNNLQVSLEDVADSAERILRYIRTYPTDEIIVHADMTGGMRFASMMMLSILQLLKYHGVQVGEILYADQAKKRVFVVTPIQRMFTLINGADEFVKFGSVRAIREYFDYIGLNRCSSELVQLLQAMERFSDAIRICRTGVIQDEIRNMGDRIRAFHNKKDKNFQETLFDQIIGPIRREYGRLLEGDVNRLDVIRWCMQKEFWQQALTLCTEWLPGYLFDSKLAYTDNSQVIRICKSEEDPLADSWKQHFIISYESGFKDKSGMGAINDSKKLLRQWLILASKEGVEAALRHDSSIRDFPDAYNMVLDIQNGKTDFMTLQRRLLSVQQFKVIHAGFGHALDLIYAGKKNTNNYKKNFVQFIRSLEYDKLFVQLQNISDAELAKLLPEQPVVEVKKKKEPQGFDPYNKWNKRKTVYRDLYAKGLLKTTLKDEESMLNLLHGFFDIRTERNRVNHADKKIQKPIGEILQMIERYLDQLKRYKSN